MANFRAARPAARSPTPAGGCPDHLRTDPRRRRRRRLVLAPRRAAAGAGRARGHPGRPARDRPEPAGLPEYADLVAAAIGEPRRRGAGRPVAGRVHRAAGRRAGPGGRDRAGERDDPPAGRDGGRSGGTNTGSARPASTAAERGGYRSSSTWRVYFLHDVPPEVVAAGARPAARRVRRGVRHALRLHRLAAGPDPGAWPGRTTGSSRPASSGRVARDRLGVEADVLPGGHLIALSQPARLADYLLGVSAAAR